MTDKPKPTFTMADLLGELRAKMPEFDQGDAMTTIEMAEAAGVSESTMRRWLKQLKAAAQVRVVSKSVLALNDRWQTVTAWAVSQN